LGGLFNSILAPVIFASLQEGTVTVAIAAPVLFLGALARKPLGVLAMTLWGTGGAAAIALLAITETALGDAILFRDRSFFGVHSVLEADEFHVYSNGTTWHGGERISDYPAARPEPLFYYHRNGPMGQVLTSSLARPDARVGVVGLGVGALSCYAQPGQEWHFYEIDAMVDRIARDPQLFTFMPNCGADIPTHLGDARMVLERQDLVFDILVIDAFSSDSVPIHLITREAMQIYLDRLAPGGVLLFHISNRYYAIDRPLGRIASDLGITARIQFHERDLENPADSGALVVAIARNEADLGPIARDPRWEALDTDGGRVWTDDYANPLELLFAKKRTER